MVTEAAFDQMIKSGELIESPNEMTPGYLRELKHTLIVSGDTDLLNLKDFHRIPIVTGYRNRGVAQDHPVAR